MPYDQSEYNAIVRETANRLETAIRKSGDAWNSVTVYAIPTTETENGRIVIAENYDTLPSPVCVVRPNDNQASTHQSWVSVPYSAMYGILWQALRIQPILPIHPI